MALIATMSFLPRLRASSGVVTIGEPQRIRDRRRLEGLLHRDFPPQVCFGIECAVLVAFDGHVRHGALQVGQVDACASGVSAGQLGESARCRVAWHVQVVEASFGPLGQSGITHVLEFFHAESERKIAGARRDRVNSAAKCF
jgi:predicted anti-sigma-YlaC factor YlaD